MNGRKTILEIIKEKAVNASAMARAIGSNRQNLHTMLHNDGKQDLSTDKLVAMANYLDYDVMLVPKTVSEKTKGYIISRTDD